MTVFIVQDQKWIDPETNQLRSKFNFEPAEKYGELEFLLKPSASPFDLAPVLGIMHSTLSDFTDDDYLLLTGNPVLMGLAVAIAADYNQGNVNMLQWSGAKNAYLPVLAKSIFEEKSS